MCTAITLRAAARMSPSTCSKTVSLIKYEIVYDEYCSLEVGRQDLIKSYWLLHLPRLLGRSQNRESACLSCRLCLQGRASRLSRLPLYGADYLSPSWDVLWSNNIKF